MSAKKPLQRIKEEKLNELLSHLHRARLEQNKAEQRLALLQADLLSLQETLESTGQQLSEKEVLRKQLLSQIEEEKRICRNKQQQLKVLAEEERLLADNELKQSNLLAEVRRQKNRLSNLVERLSLAGGSRIEQLHKAEKGKTAKLQEKLAVLEQNIRSKRRYLQILHKEEQRENVKANQIQPVALSPRLKKSAQSPGLPSKQTKFNEQVRNKNRKLLANIL